MRMVRTPFSAICSDGFIKVEGVSAAKNILLPLVLFSFMIDFDMRKRLFFVLLSVFIVSSITPGLVLGKQLPLWEFGLGGTALIIPDYRGSDESRTYLLPLPYFVYRGDFFKVDREEISGHFFKTNRLQLDMSFHGSVPVDSTKNKARQGMPDLDPTFEIGPSLEVLLAENKTSEYKITLTFPVRAVLSTDLKSVNPAGWTFTPRLNVDLFNIGKKGWDFGLSLGPIFGDQVYHNYFYQVEQAYATAERPAYSAQGGYGGMQCAFLLEKKFKKLVLGLFIRGESLHGVAFSESPLLKTDLSFMGGLYFSWIFMESKTLVEADK
jgi:MipA family protein